MVELSIITVFKGDPADLFKTVQSSIGFLKTGRVELLIFSATELSNEQLKELDDFGVKFHLSNAQLYEAMNLGLDNCSGDYVIFMNAGDTFSPNIIVEEILNSLSEPIVYFGRAHIIGNKVQWTFPEVPSNLVTTWLKYYLPNHQTMFFPLQELKSSNIYFDINLPMYADELFKIKCMTMFGYKFLDVEVCRFFLGGISTKAVSRKTLITILSETERPWKSKAHFLVKFVLDKILSAERTKYFRHKIISRLVIRKGVEK